MNSRWAYNRLRSMTLPEITHRLAEKARKLAAKNRREGWARYENKGLAPLVPGLREELASWSTETRDKIARAAMEIMEGRFAALGIVWPRRDSEHLFPAELWQLDPVTGEFWPGAERYCFDIPYRHERSLGDIKYVWEINRLQFLHSLAARVFLTDDERALSTIEACVESWYEANPPFRGLGWNSGIEIALRSISLLIVTTLVGERLRPEIVAKIRAILSASLFWMRRYPSRYSSANNHLIAEGAGEFLVTLAMPDLPAARTINSKARRTLQEEAEKQFYPDGVPTEQSPTYGAFSAEFLWLCGQAATAAGVPLGDSVGERLGRFADYIFWMADDRGRVPAIGDDDEGRVLAFVSNHETYAFEVACRIRTPGFRAGLQVFRDGGYSVLRQGRWHLVFDHGPLGYLAIAAHGHADALALVAAIDGQPLFVDPGTYLYHSGGDERDWFRGTRAHNTLNIAGADQSIITGPFNWSHKARSRLERVAEGQQWSVEASHDGYVGRFGVRHVRRIEAEGDGFAIHDRLEGGAAREAEIVFQLAPEVVVHVDGNRCVIRRHGYDLVRMFFPETGCVRIEAGCVSPSFGRKLAAQRVLWRGIVGAVGVKVAVAPTDLTGG